MKKISVDVSRIAQLWGIPLHEFIEGETYPCSKLFEALGLQKGHQKAS